MEGRSLWQDQESTRMFETRGRIYLCSAALIGLGFALSGCQTIRDAAGISKRPPDEFAVVTKAPLIIPPEYNLVPPKPGVAPTNQTSPTDTAQTTVFSDDPSTVAKTISGNFSDGEKLLLAYAGAANVSHSIRQQIAADNRHMQDADDSFTNTVLFGPTTDEGQPLDADAEKKRLDETKGTQPAEKKPTDSSN
jgi:hypothetical protein